MEGGEEEDWVRGGGEQGVRGARDERGEEEMMRDGGEEDEREEKDRGGRGRG